MSKLGLMPKIEIDWNAINLEIFDNSRKAALAHIDRILNETDRFLENKGSAWLTNNCFSRAELYLISEVMKAAKSPDQQSVEKER